MKKTIFYLMMVLPIFSGSALIAQTAALPNILANPNEQVSIPITVTNFTSIGSIMLTIQVNTDVLTFMGLTGGPSGMIAGTSGSKVIISWYGPPYYTNANGILVSLVFKYHGPGTSPLTFIQSGCEVIKMPGFVPVAVAYANGQVSPYMGNAATAILLNQICVVPGTPVSVPIKYEGFQSNVGSIVQKVYFDNTKMAFINLSGTGTLAGASAITSSNIVTITWENVSGASINYPENQVVLHFNYFGNTGTTIEFYPGCIITANTAVNIPVSYFSGSITLNPVPSPSITAGGPTTFCNGSSVILTAPAGTGFNYLWSNYATTQAITVTSGGTFSVTVSNGSCSGTSSPTTVIVNPLPEVSITPDPAAFCTGGSLLLNASGGTGYLWSNSQTTQSITVTTGGTYTVTVTDANGCIASANRAVAEHSRPTPTINGQASVCSGSSGIVYFTETGMTDYQWDISPGGTITFGAGSNIILATWNNSGTQWVSVNYTNGYGCPAFTPALFPVTVFPEFLPGSIASSQTIGYNTAPLPLTGVAPIGGNPPYTYQWQSSTDGTNFNNIAGATDLNYAPGILAVTTWYRQMQASADNCGSSYTNILIINVNPQPYITVTSPNGGEEWLPGSTHMITWDDNITENVRIDLHKGSVFHQQIIAATPSSGTYSWTITGDQTPGADYKVKITSNTDNAVYDFSDADFSITDNVPANLVIQDVTVSGGQVNCYNATQSITVAGSGTVFIILNGGSATMIAGQGLSYLPGTIVESGGYLHGYIAPEGPWCSSLVSSMITMDNGETKVPSCDMKNKSKVYPNPTSGDLIVDFSGFLQSNNIEVEIYGMYGELILKYSTSGGGKQEFSLSGRPVGIYFLRVVSGINAEIHKILKK